MNDLAGDSAPAWKGNDNALPSARIAALSASLLPSERKVTQAVLGDPRLVAEATAQELADAIGVSRSSVIRTCQRLGYKGYPQLRVATAFQLAAQSPAHTPCAAPSAAGKTLSGSRSGKGGTQNNECGNTRAKASTQADVLEFMRGKLKSITDMIPYLLDALNADIARQAVIKLEQAERVLVVGNGLSSPLASDFALRLTSIGRHAEFVADGIGQQVTARQLGEESVCMVISGSGDTRTSINAAEAAHKGGATTMALTSFSPSPLAAASDIVLVATSVGGSFQNEISEASRVAHVIFLELLVDVLRARAAARCAGRSTGREQFADIIAENLNE